MKTLLITALFALTLIIPDLATGQTLEVEGDKLQKEDLQRFEASNRERQQQVNAAFQHVLETDRQMKESRLWEAAEKQWQRQLENQRDIANKAVPRLGQLGRGELNLGKPMQGF
jgi:GTPase SAR1 family protein